MSHHHHNHHDRCAPECDDQLPTIAVVGRGPKGNDSHVEIAKDSCIDTRIKGYMTDGLTGEKIVGSEWVTKNINGGELRYQYNLRPYTVPPTFTITFVYERPGKHEWRWTTPAIPFLWETEDGHGAWEHPDKIVGTGVATIFLKTMNSNKWTEKLTYPNDPDTGKPYPREFFNAPNVGDPWVSQITFGKGGDLEIPDFDDLAKILGLSKENLFKILEGNKFTINGIEAANLRDYIDKCDKRDLDHIHADLGFNSTGHGANTFGGKATVKAYIDDKVGDVAQENTKLKNAIDDILNKIYGGGEMNQNTGHIIWPNESKNSKIPVADLNIWAGEEATGFANAIRSRAELSNNDLHQK